MLNKLLSNNKIKNLITHDENQYLNLITDIIEHGDTIDSRNGITKVVFGYVMHFSLQNNILPLLTTKKVAWKTCLKELLWFISGKTDNKILKQQNVKIWNDNGSREFLDSRNLNHLEVDDLGPVYGHQWRHFNADYTTCNENYNEKGIDQLNNIIKMLKDPKEKYSRRIILSAWNPCQLDQMALPPCHILIHFHVSSNNELSGTLYQRSGDVGLGVPFNIASYSILIHLIAHHCDLKPCSFNYYLGNAHIYDDHLEPLNIQSKNTPFLFPFISISNKYDTIDEYKFEDFVIDNYSCHKQIKMQMRK